MTLNEIIALREIQILLAVMGLFLVAALVAKVTHRNAYELIDLHRKIHEEEDRRRELQDR
jgi:hypothetical protein